VRGLLGELLSSQTDITVVDMEAGLEHLSRSGGTLRYVDQLLVVAEPYARAIETARRTIRLASELGIGSIALLVNKVRDDSELRLLDKVREETGARLVGAIPYDEVARVADREGRPPIEVAPESPLVRSIEQLASTLEAEWSAAAA
jgi:CO dehydrogenase maturation factor